MKFVVWSIMCWILLMVGFPLTSNPIVSFCWIGLELIPLIELFFNPLSLDFMDWSFLLPELPHHHVSVVLHCLKISIPVYPINCCIILELLKETRVSQSQLFKHRTDDCAALVLTRWTSQLSTIRKSRTNLWYDVVSLHVLRENGFIKREREKSI